MIDIHTHILPGIDDGCKTPKESVRMLWEEARMGVSEVVLTPHFYADQTNIPHFLDRRQRAWDRLRPCLRRGMPRLRLGAEVQYFEGICSVDGLEELRIEGTDLLLLEMPFSRWTDRMIENVLELNSRDGLQILLAHFERYIAYQSKSPFPMLLDEGVLLQSNISFFTHWQTRHQAASMLNQRALQIVGSDCHNMTTRPPAWNALPTKLWDQVDHLSLLFSAKWMSRKHEAFREDALDFIL